MQPLLIDSLHRSPPAQLKRGFKALQQGAFKLTTEILEGNPCVIAPHHKVINETLDRVFAVGADNHIKRLIINIPPGYSKTSCAVWSFIARGFVINPASRFIHTSYSQELVLDNSAKVKQLLESEAYEYFNGPLNIAPDTKAKGLWRTQEGGGMRAVQTGGGLTGFRAGQADKSKFTGAIVVDDPLKPDDARSRKMTADQNKRYNNTIASRLAHEDVPIIVIMQRIAAFTGEFNNQDDLTECGDMCEYLLRGGSGEKWHHLELPVEIDNSLEYPAAWTHGIPIDHGLDDGPLWEFKHTKEDIARLRRADIYTYSSQYGQRPKKRLGDTIIDGKWFQRYTVAPTLSRIEIFVDTANKDKEAHDYTVFLAAGVTVIDGQDHMFILDVLRGKWKIPQLYPTGMNFWNKWKAQGATKINIEDKQSGTFLIQSMFETIKSSVVAIPRDKDKFTRVNGVVERISSGHVHIPIDADWVSDFINECEEFTDDDSHSYDDQVDALADGIENLVRIIPLKTEQQFITGFM